MKGSLAAVGLLQASRAAAEYVWPDKNDELEDLMFLQSGYIHNGFIDEVNPCSFGTNIKGRQNAAEWVRAGFHDMITHDAAAGTGGLDASIIFEKNREENPGDFIDNTFGFTNGFFSPKASAADLLALTVVTAVYSCNGPKIPFRAGRIDATEEGIMGVPQPQEDLDTQTQRFATAGFNTSDMIAMVACGHTLGGIHGSNFPEITGDDSEGQVSRFEGNEGDSFAEFDNKVVTQYLDGTTENLLVVGGNDTLNSDKRVFGADSNATMEALADTKTFQSTCQDILQRMIDTVPSSVTLSDPLEAIDIKPYIEKLGLTSDGKIAFEGRIRVRVSSATGRDIDDLAMHLTYADRSGKNQTAAKIQTTQPTLQLGLSTGLFGETFKWFEFATTLDAAAGISKFHVHLATPSTGAATVHDNAGHGFPIDDALLYQQPQSCLNITIVDNNMDLKVTAAVRKELAGEAAPVLRLVNEVPRDGVIVPRLEILTSAFAKTGQEKAGYVLYQVDTPLLADSWATHFDIALGGDDHVVEFQSTSALTDEPCAAL
ncbi:heme peroxidase [Xylariomycetidae sp. FL0641]|nr:heme peroxidase [Xylariomycetidae sp. FL0641]